MKLFLGKIFLFRFLYSGPLVAVGQTKSTSKDVNVRCHIQILPMPKFLWVFVILIVFFFCLEIVTGLENFMTTDKFSLRTARILVYFKVVHKIPAEYYKTKKKNDVLKFLSQVWKLNRRTHATSWVYKYTKSEKCKIGQIPANRETRHTFYASVYLTWLW